MYDEVIKKILETVDGNFLSANYPKFSGEGYRAYKIDSKNFHEIKNIDSNQKIVFVDGGNAEIIGAKNFSLSLIRVGYVIYQGVEKISAKKFEVLAFVQAISQNNEIYYKATFFTANSRIKLEEMSFSSFDHTLMNGMNRAEIGSVATAIRRFAELKIAKLASDEKIADIIVLDGSIQVTLTDENKHLNKLYESCSKNNVVLAALSKTTSLFTDNGNLLSAVLVNLGRIPTWFYYPIVEINSQNYKAEMFFAKLHKNSRHVFKIEFFKDQKAKAEESINLLAKNCVDPIFIGYPYGLVEADRIARISNQERESLRTIFLVKLRNNNIEKYLNSSNAHEILDSISF